MTTYSTLTFTTRRTAQHHAQHILRHTAPHRIARTTPCTTPHNILRHTPLHRSAPHRTTPQHHAQHILRHTPSHRSAPHRTTSHYTASSRTAQHRTPHCTAQHHTAPHHGGWLRGFAGAAQGGERAAGRKASQPATSFQRNGFPKKRKESTFLCTIPRVRLKTTEATTAAATDQHD